VTRRLPLALLGAALGLVIAIVPTGGAGSTPAGASHPALSSGHLAEGLLVVEHPRAQGPLLPLLAVAAPAPSFSEGRARWVVASVDRTSGSSAVTPPTAIRGPPA